MAGPGLQRSMVTFRRSGSSGLVWEDRLFSGSDVLNGKSREEGGVDVEFREMRHSHSLGMIGQMSRSRSNNGGGQTYRASRVTAAVVDPPSPKVSGCGFFGIFRNSGAAKGSKLRRR